MPCDDGACAAEGVARLSDAGELLGVVRLGRGGIGDRALEVPLAWAARRDFTFGLPAPTGEGSAKSALPRPGDSPFDESTSPARSVDPFTIPAEMASGRSSIPSARACSRLAASSRADPSEYVAALSGIAALPGPRERLGALYLGDLLGLGVEQVVERAFGKSSLSGTRTPPATRSPRRP